MQNYTISFTHRNETKTISFYQRDAQYIDEMIGNLIRWGCYDVVAIQL